MMDFRTLKTKEVADICGVTEECIRQNAKKVGIVLENGKAHEYTEDELKKIQVQLMANSNNQGNGSEVVKETSKAALELGALTIAATQSVEATQQLCRVLMQKAQQFEALQLEQQKTKQLQLELDKYVNWKSASEIKSEFKLPYRPGIEKVALLLKLKENEDWIARFYDDTHMYKKILYSPEAVERIVEYFKED